MFPVLVVMHARLARNEEADMRAQFGEAYERYARRTPRFIPSSTWSTRANGTRG
jgi:protein-S-isoprenylcysteine O-methyltransferase Ste14